ncbi:NADPH-dependent FMN reductase [Streptomyces albipurpureus]|uniref:NAD(P)H-dependent oxidoreductase n=1 Tax=Streptomyces albipurpureus TaxID=2897419 RepID=A0ABT0V3M9_9ACTN|nr:NAD(P)H-dependent oxidoreductase [Streptomyces sp. CWNU-1]MCM2394163.1 NAD(P)H-dependent oxidoreductase [Streptomyces sp. CWNU-1]
MTSDTLAVCGIVGSLRRNSWNRKLLEAAEALAPIDTELRISKAFDDIPLFNEDLVGSEPAAVLRLREEVASADALMIATPEYNGGAPGVLKNALDWLSLPLGGAALEGKPVALMGTSPGRLGTARAQFELRNMFLFSRSPVMPGPELLLGHAHQHFDEHGKLTDSLAIERIALLFRNLRKYAQLNSTEAVPLR